VGVSPTVHIVPGQEILTLLHAEALTPKVPKSCCWGSLHEPTELSLGEARSGVQNNALVPAPIDASAAPDSALRAFVSVT
jgi:hypothetical protein